jgi:CHAT domain-containing protein
MESVSISYVPSASVLAQLSGRVTPQRGLEFLGVAQSAPRLSGQPSDQKSFSSTLLPIPFAKREVEDLARMFPNGRSVVYIDDQATETAIKETALRRFRTLHFATHALADSVFPERSAIYLVPSPGSQEDGVLRWPARSRSAADLAVLSGCQTA